MVDITGYPETGIGIPLRGLGEDCGVDALLDEQLELCLEAVRSRSESSVNDIS